MKQEKLVTIRNRATLAAAGLTGAALASTAGAQSTLNDLTNTATWNMDGVTGIVAAILVGVGVPVTVAFTAYRLGKRGANKA